jgi:hypothetical protein
MLKSPVAAIANPASVASPEFVTVKVCVVAAVPTTTLPNVICVGFDTIPPIATPLPSSGTTTGATDRLLTVAVSAPGWFPLAVGEKLTPTEQEVSATRFAAHVVSAGASA